MQSIDHWIEASMAGLARGLGDHGQAGADLERELSRDVALPLAPAWLTSTDDAVQLDRSNRLHVVRLDIV